jgi:hypothetical protein
MFVQMAVYFVQPKQYQKILYRKTINQHFLAELVILFLVLNATFSNISAKSWQQVLVVEEAGVPGENHRRWASNW